MAEGSGTKGSPVSSAGKESACNAEDPSSIPGEGIPTAVFLGFPGGLDGKKFVCNAGDLGLIPGSGRIPGEGDGYPLQYFCLETSMDRGAWWATVHGVTKSQTLLSD